MSKIGKNVLMVVYLLLILVTVAVTVVFCMFFTNAEKDNLRESSHIASNVLQHALKSRADEATMISKLLADDEDFRNAIEAGNKEAMLSTWENIPKSTGMFGVFLNSNTIIAAKTENANLSAGGIFNAIAENKDGLTSDDELYLYYRSVEKKAGITVIVGYAYSDTSSVDDVMEQTGCQATIFYDNQRISTTLSDSTGANAVGTLLDDETHYDVVKLGNTLQLEKELFGDDYMATYTPIYDEYGVAKGAYFTGCPMAEMIKTRNLVIITCVAVALLMLIIAAVLISIFVKKCIAAPIDMVKNMAVEMERGNLRANPGITGKKPNNEVGMLADALDSAITNLNRYVSDISTRMQEMSEGNFAYESDVQYVGDFVSIGESAGELRMKLNDVINSINISADEVYSGSGQISCGADILAEGTTRQAATVEELSASVSEISDQIALNAENAEKAKELSNTSIEIVNNQSVQIQDMIQAMSNIETSANEISNIIQTINEIAFQTDILALNAAVEAARAGDAGRGFAVVADEVRNLAIMSAEAAQTTGNLISSCIKTVDTGSTIASNTAETMMKVIEITNETNNLIEGIAQQSINQAEAVHQVKSGIEQISEVVQQNSATAEESASSCEQLNSQAMTLRDKISVFHT